MIAQRQHAEDRLDRSGSAEQVSDHRLGGTHRDTTRRGAEHGFEGPTFGDITGRRRGAVSIHVLDSLRGQPRVIQCVVHRLGATASILGRQRHMVRIAAHAKALDLGIDWRAARPGRCILLQHYDAGAIAQYKAIPIRIPGSRRRLGVVIASRQRARRRETAQAHFGGGHFSAAGQHGVRIALGDHPRRHADVVRACCAGRDDGDIRAAQAVAHGQIAANHIGDRTRDEKRRDPPGTAAVDNLGVFLDLTDATDTRADRTADPCGLLVTHFVPRVRESLDARRHAVLNKGVDLAGVFAGEVGVGVEVANTGTETCGIGIDCKSVDRRRAALASENRRPGGIHIVPHGGHQSKSRNDYPSTVHCVSPDLNAGPGSNDDKPQGIRGARLKKQKSRATCG